MVDTVKIVWVSLTVMLTLAGALLLNHGAKYMKLTPEIFFIIISGVIIINIVKLKLWAFIYQRYYLHESYPITALFFPLIYTIAIFNEESAFSMQKLIGITLIMLGIIMVGQKHKETE